MPRAREGAATLQHGRCRIFIRRSWPIRHARAPAAECVHNSGTCAAVRGREFWEDGRAASFLSLLSPTLSPWLLGVSVSKRLMIHGATSRKS